MDVLDQDKKNPKKDLFQKKDVADYVRTTIYVNRGKSAYHNGKFFKSRRKGRILYCYHYKTKPKIVFLDFDYKLENNKFKNKINRYTIVVKNSKLYFYHTTKLFGDANFKCRDISHLNFFDKFWPKDKNNLEMLAANQRMLRCLKVFIKQNKLPIEIEYNHKNIRWESIESAVYQDEDDFDCITKSDSKRKKYANILIRKINVSLCSVCERAFKKYTFPLLRDFNILNPLIANRYFREQRLKILIKKCFGNSGKQITNQILGFLHNKSAPKDKCNIFNIGLLFKNILTPEIISQNLLKLVDLSISLDLNPGNIQRQRKFWKLLSMPKRLSVLNDMSPIFYYKDTVQMFNDFPGIVFPKDAKDLLEIHDYYAKEVNKLKHPLTPFPYEEKDLRLNKKIEDFEIKLPLNNHELVSWGQDQHHCVGSYAKKVLTRQIFILGVFKNQELKYCIEYDWRKRNILQFLGKYNAPPEENDKILIEKELKNSII